MFDSHVSEGVGVQAIVAPREPMLFFKTLLFTILVPGMVTVGVPYYLVWSDMQHALGTHGALGLLGGVPLAAGVAVYIWCAWDFVTTGHGTPNPGDPPQRLVLRGLYRRARNPMYVGILLIIAGEAVLFDSLTLLLYAALLGILFHLRVLFYEEPHLRQKFGAAYEAYCHAVPRWLPHL